MAPHSAVGRFVLILAARGNQHRGHHGGGAVGSGQHIAHHIAVIVLAGPHIAALALDGFGDGVVDQAVFVGDAGLVKVFHIFFHENLLKDFTELPVVNLGNGIFGGEKKILLDVQGVVHAAAGKPSDGAVQVMRTGDNAGPLKLMDQLTGFMAVLVGENQLALAGLLDSHL